MFNVAVIGTQWGDEGKGKIVDWLSEKADVIVRFQGTNSKQGRQIINNSKLNIIAADTLSEAAKKAVEASKY